MSVQATTILYKGRDQTGETKYGYLAQNDRYGHENSRELQDTGFYEQIQSVKLFDSSVQDICQLFFTGDQFNNVYQSWYSLKGKGFLNITGNWGPVRSYMLVATSRDGENELRLSYRDLFYHQRYHHHRDRLTTGPGMNSARRTAGRLIAAHARSAVL